MKIEIGSNDLARLKAKIIRAEKHCDGFEIFTKTHKWSEPKLLLAIPSEGCTITYYSGGRVTDSIDVIAHINGDILIFDIEPSAKGEKSRKLVAASCNDYPIDFTTDTVDCIWIYPDFPEETAIEDDNGED